MREDKHFKQHAKSQLNKIPYKTQLLNLGELPDDWEGMPIHTLQRLVEITLLKQQMDAAELVVRANWKENTNFKVQAKAKLKTYHATSTSTSSSSTSKPSNHLCPTCAILRPDQRVNKGKGRKFDASCDACRKVKKANQKC